MIEADPLALAGALIRCASITPVDAGAQDVLAVTLKNIGFRVVPLQFGEVRNLYARIGDSAPHFCFAGHTDVVPPGDGAWGADPFGAEIRDGRLYGRGACDMKGAIAAFVAAAAGHLAEGTNNGSISLLVTGDEEGPARDGTARVLEWMADHDERPDFCLVGEPTNPARLGEVIKIGRRGSLNATLTVHGRQGHVAYPGRADNPVHRLLRALGALIAAPLDAGSTWFEPSGLQITSVDVGNRTTNVIPTTARAALNIRFNNLHRGADLAAWLRAVLGYHAAEAEIDVAISAEPFLTAPGPEIERLAKAIETTTGIAPRLDTAGGTSDARFIAAYCPVAEFGLVGGSMHQADEHVPIADIVALVGIYRAVLKAFLG
ncbi:MAG: succinyl-diaminopimelate desuccinylase [Rhodospirillales bacterium]|nr:succinyl-diaminopimelate desuccinylase [Rhodospirillales bacterium]